VRTGGDARNRAYLAGHVASSAPTALEALVFDPQTSGGLLAAVAPERAATMQAAFDVEDLHLRRIGAVEEGEGVVLA
jgi:selenide,water dikinase